MTVTLTRAQLDWFVSTFGERALWGIPTGRGRMRRLVAGYPPIFAGVDRVRVSRSGSTVGLAFPRKDDGIRAFGIVAQHATAPGGTFPGQLLF